MAHCQLVILIHLFYISCSIVFVQTQTCSYKYLLKYLRPRYAAASWLPGRYAAAGWLPILSARKAHAGLCIWC